MQIRCKECGKLFEKKGQREYCIKCRNKLDKIRIYERTHTDEYKQYQHQQYLERKALKPITEKWNKW